MSEMQEKKAAEKGSESASTAKFGGKQIGTATKNPTELRVRLLDLLRDAEFYERFEDEQEKLKFFFYMFDSYNTQIGDRFPTYKTFDRMDWVVNISLNPDFFGSKLETRNNNGILTSALLVTISAPAFLEPPFGDTDKTRYKIWMYLMALSTLFFLFSIFLGILFSTNVARAYAKADHFLLTAAMYNLFNSVTLLMIIGSILLIFSFGFAAVELLGDTDVIVLAIITVIAVLIYFYLLFWSNKLPDERQKAITNFFINAFDPKGNGDLDHELMMQVLKAKVTEEFIHPKTGVSVSSFFWKCQLEEGKEATAS